MAEEAAIGPKIGGKEGDQLVRLILFDIINQKALARPGEEFRHLLVVQVPHRRPGLHGLLHGRQPQALAIPVAVVLPGAVVQAALDPAVLAARVEDEIGARVIGREFLVEAAGLDHPGLLDPLHVGVAGPLVPALQRRPARLDVRADPLRQFAALEMHGLDPVLLEEIIERPGAAFVEPDLKDTGSDPVEPGAACRRSHERFLVLSALFFGQYAPGGPPPQHQAARDRTKEWQAA